MAQSEFDAEHIYCYCMNPLHAISKFSRRLDDNSSEKVVCYQLSYSSRSYNDSFFDSFKFVRWFFAPIDWVSNFLELCFCNIMMEYDILLKDSDANKLSSWDPSLKYEKMIDEFEYCTINNRVHISKKLIPFLIKINFIFNGYIRANYSKYFLNNIENDDFSIIEFIL